MRALLFSFNRHEYDHLEGILYPQRIKDLKMLGLEDAFPSMHTSSHPIVKMGDPRLYQRSKEISFADADLDSLIAAMETAMKEDKGVGIAAPHIGVSKRVIIFGFDSNPRYPHVEAIPFTVLINPRYEVLSDEMADDWEGCLSIPGLGGLVPRYLHIRYEG